MVLENVLHGFRRSSPATRQSSAPWRPSQTTLRLEALEERTLLSFLPVANYAYGQTPADVVVADFNGDQHADLVIANQNSNSLTILLGNNLGTYQYAGTINVGAGQNSVAAGDFNADGKMDLVVADKGSPGTVSILLGNGDGTFKAPVNLSAGNNPAWVLTKDLRGDGKQDIVVANQADNTLSVFMGNGDGTFSAPTTYGVGAGPAFVRIIDINKDGHPDLVTANTTGNDVSVLMNNGDGTFKNAVNYATDLGPTKVAVGDFYTEGRVDLVVATSNGTISMLHGNGDGTFQAAVNTVEGIGKLTIGVADFNHTGKDDIAVAVQGSNTISVLDGNGDGTFKSAITNTVASGITTIRAGDFNDDGKMDLLAVSGSSNTVSILTNTPSYYATGAGWAGHSEVKVFNSFNNTLKYDFNAFDPALVGSVRVALGDITGDGVPDIVVAAGPTDSPLVHVYDGLTGQLVAGPVGDFLAYNAEFRGGMFVATGYFENNNHADIVVGAEAGGGPHVKVFSGLDGHVIYSFFAYDATFLGGVRVAVGDVNGDGHDDIITGAGAGGGPHVKVFDGTNPYNVLKSFMAYDTVFHGGVFVSAADFNGDGKADIVTGAGPGGGPHVKVFSGADGSVLQSFYAYSPEFTSGVRVGVMSDVNNNGSPEIITGASFGGGPHVEIFDGATLARLDSFFAFDPFENNGVFVGGM